MPGSWEAAEAYDASFGRLCAGAVGDLLDQLGPSADRQVLLDLGCGPGTVLAEERSRRAGRAVVGVDPEESMLVLARQRHPGAPLVRAALPDLPFRTGAFDAVAANFVVNHAPDPRAALHEVRRVTRPGGRLAVTLWSGAPSPLQRLWDDVLAAAGVAPPARRTLPADRDFERTADGLHGLLGGAGLEAVEVRELSWLFRVDRDDLWGGVAGGLATIGQTYRAQSPPDRRRVRDAYRRITGERHPGSELRLPAAALLGGGTVPHRSPR